MSYVDQEAGEFSHVNASLHFNWTLRRVGKAFERGSVLHSSFYNQADNMWFLELFTNGDGEENRGYITLYLRLDRNSGQKVAHAYYEFTIEGTAVQMKFSADRTMTFNRGEGMGWWKLIKKDDILCPSKGFIKDDTLKIQCFIDIREGSNCSDIQVPESDFACDLGSLIDHDRFSDVKIVCKERTFNCSRNVLSARSPVFNAMFQHDMKESSTGEVVVEDVDARIMEQVLNYIYTDNVKSFDGIAGDLLAAAEKYHLVRLKAMCEKYLAKWVCEDNALETLMIAKEFSLEKLKNNVLVFLKSCDPSKVQF